MSSTLSISITRSEVYEEVYKITGYKGKKESLDGTAYEVIAGIDENDDILTRYFDEACASVVDALKRYVGASPTINSTGCSMTFEMPANWDENIGSSVKDSVVDYFIAHICYKWMRLVNHSDEQKYAADAETDMMEIRKKMAHSKKPSRNMYIN